MTKILIVEDNEILLESIASDLQLRNYRVVEATDGQKALDLLAHMDQDPPDIIISDIAMPRVDGFELLDTLRQDPKWRELPILFLTAFNSANSLRRSWELGIDDYIEKPFRMDDLVLIIENRLRRVKGLQQQMATKLEKAHSLLVEAVSHELHTPLTSIYAGSELLTEILADLPDDSAVELAQLIKKGADRLNRLTNQILMLLQIDSGSLEKLFHRSKLKWDLHEITASTIHHLEDELRTSGRPVTFNVSSIPAQIVVEGLGDSLQTMVEEPLRNAAAASGVGGIIDVSLRANGDNALVTIQDSGYGIPDADLDRVWDRFVQINRLKFEQQGAGLGLPITRSLAEIHGGGCSIFSEPGQGSSFLLRLPLCRPA